MDDNMRKFATFAGAAASVITILVSIKTLGWWSPSTTGTEQQEPVTAITSESTPAPPLLPPQEPTEESTPTPSPTPTPTPDTHFILVSQEWGPCQVGYGCDVYASFRNTGGFGNAIATFYLLNNDQTHWVAKCSVTIPYADEGESVTARCHANNQLLDNYLRTGQVMHLNTRINNP